MNTFFIIVLAAAAGYAFKRYEDMKRRTARGSTRRVLVLDPDTGQVIAVAGQQVGFEVGGVSIYNATPAPNKPDQLAAALPTNDAATNRDGAGYYPAFGPDENVPLTPGGQVC